ncbi:MAG: penicillin-binding protein [Pirellula sp.]|nr:penicillin-binding protein [Pirellula sp.]
MVRTLLFVVCCAASVWSSPATAQPDAAVAPAIAHTLSAEDAAAVDEAVAEQMEKQGLVGVAVGLLHRGEIVYLKGYGLADRERRTPATTATVFNWASNSKPLCAVAAMQLVEQGRLDLDADVRTYVPEFPDHGTRITMRELLCHQSGIPHYSNGRVVPGAQRNPRTRPLTDPLYALDMFSESPLLFTPGKKTSYSSYAYILASAVAQRAGVGSFAEQVQARIAQPLGMKSLQIDVATNGQPHWATGYLENDDGDVVRATELANYWKHGAGAYKSNIADFARWARALLHRRLLKPQTYREMWRPQPLTSGTATTWGLGFTVEQQNGLKVSHNGKQDEATSRLVLYPDAQHGIVILTNCGHGEPGAISTAIYQALED